MGCSTSTYQNSVKIRKASNVGLLGDSIPENIKKNGLDEITNSRGVNLQLPSVNKKNELNESFISEDDENSSDEVDDDDCRRFRTKMDRMLYKLTSLKNNAILLKDKKSIRQLNWYVNFIQI